MITDGHRILALGLATGDGVADSLASLVPTECWARLNNEGLVLWDALTGYAITQKGREWLAGVLR